MLTIKHLGLVDYQTVWQQMKDFTLQRNANTPDELWLLEHYPVYTQGQAGKPEHVLAPPSIPLIQTDRGGQITYHGPGQLVAYTLLDIGRRNLGVRTLVCQLEQTLVDLLAHYAITAETRCKAPGVYVEEKKIASLGLRVKNGCTYHGIALNVNMDLTPFLYINPCGHAAMQMTQICDFDAHITIKAVSQQYTKLFLERFT